MSIQFPSAHRSAVKDGTRTGTWRVCDVRIRGAIVVGLCALLLGACGQKGDLYLPEADPGDTRRRPPLEDVDTGDLRE